MTLLPFADAGKDVRIVFIRDLVLPASIGIYPHEHQAPQRVRINVFLAVADATAGGGNAVGADELSRVVDYEKLTLRLRQVVQAGHTRLVETLAERLAAECLGDDRVRQVRVRVEKLDVFPDVAAVGVEIQRHRNTNQGAKA